MKLKWAIKSWIENLQPDCIHCGRGSSKLLCKSCQIDLRVKGACPRCTHAPLDQNLELCIPCEHEPRAWKSLTVGFHYEEGVKNWLIDLKSGLRAERYREILSLELPRPQPQIEFDGVVSFVSDPGSNRKRMFDPSEVLGQTLSRCWNLPYLGIPFRRLPFLAPQKQLSNLERRLFLERTVFIDPLWSDRRFGRLLLVDDLMTSGASLEWGARLLSSLCKDVHLFSLFRAFRRRI